MEQSMKQSRPCSGHPGHAKKRNVSTPGNKGPQLKKISKERLEVSPIKPQLLFPCGGDPLIRKGETSEEYIARLNMEEAEEIAEERSFEKNHPVLVAAADDPTPDAPRIYAKEMHVVDWSQAWDWSNGMIGLSLGCLVVAPMLMSIMLVCLSVGSKKNYSSEKRTCIDDRWM